MQKGSHKLRARDVGEVAAVVAKASSLSAAARQLGVDRSTLHRWIAAKKVPAPARSQRRTDAGTTTPRPSGSPDAWVRAIRRRFQLSTTELELLRLAGQALTIADGKGVPPAVRLAAMARFQALVKQINLEEDIDGQAQAPAADVRPFQRRVG